MRSINEARISENIQCPALFPDDQTAQEEAILARVKTRTGLDLHHRSLSEISRFLEDYNDEAVARIAEIVADCSNDEQLHRLRKLEHQLSISAVLVPRR